MHVEIRQLPDVQRYRTLGSEELANNFLVSNLFRPNEISFTYFDIDRTMIGSAMPAQQSLQLENAEILAAGYFLERRELGVINMGGKGNVAVDGTEISMTYRDALYLGKGSRDIRFNSDNVDQPAKFYLVSYPAHASHPNKQAAIEAADPLKLGSQEAANKRTIYKYVYIGGIESCQLVMGLTEMASGSVWNTMPAHHHMRRSEVYCYFGLAEEEVVLHLMGTPDETRHIVVREGQAVFSPGWSIHAGIGTGNYSFIWAMGGENRDYTDMQPVSMGELR